MAIRLFLIFCMMKRLILPLILQIFMTCCLVGCNGYKMSVDRGEFDVSLPTVVRGAEYDMDKKSSATRVTLAVREHAEKSTHLSKVYNGAAVVCYDEEHCPNGKFYYEKGVANSSYEQSILEPSLSGISYNFKSFPVALNIEWLYKSENRFFSWGLGADPLPYLTAAIGMNGRFGEIGVSSYWGIDYGNTHYDYRALQSQITFIMTDADIYYYEGEYEAYQFHCRGGVGAYLSLFLGPLALTYAPGISSPWLWKDELEKGTVDYAITFEFPLYLSNYFGVTYNLKKRMQYSLGLTVINGWQLDERLFFASTSISHLF